MLKNAIEQETIVPISKKNKNMRSRRDPSNLRQYGALERSPKKSNSDRVKINSSKKANVLCIDDSQTIQTIVQKSLEMAGYHVIGHTDPLKSVMFLLENNQNPDIIIMDIKMPNVEGYKLLQLIKRSTKLTNIPVIMLTSQNRHLDKMRAQSLGAVAYMTKPFSCNNLIRTVDRILNCYK